MSSTLGCISSEGHEWKAFEDGKHHTYFGIEADIFCVHCAALGRAEDLMDDDDEEGLYDAAVWGMVSS